MNNKVDKQFEDLPITDEKNSDLLPTSESHLDTQNQSFFSTFCSFSCFLQVYLPKMTRFTRQDQFVPDNIYIENMFFIFLPDKLFKAVQQTVMWSAGEECLSLLGIEIPL